jgi:hypothetical protein
VQRVKGTFVSRHFNESGRMVDAFAHGYDGSATIIDLTDYNVHENASKGIAWNPDASERPGNDTGYTTSLQIDLTGAHLLHVFPLLRYLYPLVLCAHAGSIAKGIRQHWLARKL